MVVCIDKPLFSTMRSENGNRVLKTVLGKIDVPDANRYSLKGFRRWVTTEIKRPGSTTAVILGIGGWRGHGYKHYIQLHEDEEECVMKLISVIGQGKDSSDGDCIDLPAQCSASSDLI